MNLLAILRWALGFNVIEDVGQVVGVLHGQAFHPPVIDLDGLARLGIDDPPHAVAFARFESHAVIIRRADGATTPTKGDSHGS